MINEKFNAIDLFAIAHRVMIEAGFLPDPPQTVETELHLLDDSGQGWKIDTSTRDLRQLLWSSIDDAQSRDLDQVEYAETRADGTTRLLVGIADVDSLVGRSSALDLYASTNATSVYTGVKTFPMLPEELSTNRTSLLPKQDRLALIIELIIDSGGEVKARDVFRAVLCNRAKLAYESIGMWLDGITHQAPPEVIAVAGLEEQLRLQQDASIRLGKLRAQNGALELETVQVTPSVNDGQVTGLTVVGHNGARDLIENFMIAANVAMAQFLESKSTLSLRRVVRTPERWSRIVQIAHEMGDQLPDAPDSRALADFLARRKVADPLHYPDLSLSIVKLLGPGEYTVLSPGAQGEGHFGLAVPDYTHSTAPNRRYADLVTQRLVKAVLNGEPSPYTEDELTAIAKHCTEREDAARKVERQIRKVAAAVLLADRIGEDFDAIVTGVTPKGTFARTLSPPVDGRVVRGEDGLQVGERVRVRLLATDTQRGFIDFGREQ